MPEGYSTKLPCLPYLTQVQRWPTHGRHLLAQATAHTVVLYQAYGREIAEATCTAGHFGGGGWKPDRMSWVKPNFLWMMFRSGWASKPMQERILALHVDRAVFETWLARAVHSHYVPERYPSTKAWSQALKHSDLRLQWDPDHTPYGSPCERRALQLGLRGAALQTLAREALHAVEDITDFVHCQAQHVRAQRLEALLCPQEDVYPLEDPALRAHLGLAAS